MLKHIRNCRRITELISLSQEQSLTSHEQISVKFHLTICPACRAFEQNNRVLKDIVQAHKNMDSNLEKDDHDP